MPKAEKGSVKDIAKRIKAKGLQKLKFYCQMCEKQCRDANGFKCHIQSESHLRQMKLFSENASGIMDQYSREFEKVYLDTLRMLHGTATVNANNVYQQVIRDKQHIHMNATIWATLSDFCQYLGKTGKANVEENERGWYITYINRDASLILRQQETEKRMQAEQQAEADLAKRMEERRKEAALAMDRAGFQKMEVTNLQPRKDDEEPIQISLGSSSALQQQQDQKKKKKKTTANVLDAGSDSEEEDDNNKGNSTLGEHTSPALPVAPQRDTPQQQTRGEKRPREMSRDNDARTAQAKQPRRSSEGLSNAAVTATTSKTKSSPSPSDNVWLYRDIVVRIVSRKYKKGRYFRRKAYVDRVMVSDDNTGEVTAEVTLVPEKGDDPNEDVILTLSQDCLETVIPKSHGDGPVRILKGPYRGKKGTIISLNKDDYEAKLELSNGTILRNIDFEDFSQLV